MAAGRFLILAAALAAAVSAADAGERKTFGQNAPFALSDLPDSRLARDLRALPPEVRTKALQRLHEFTFPAADLDTLRVDRNGFIFYADPVRPSLDPRGRRSAVESGTARATVRIDPAKVFRLHSKRGASRVVYLNFRGETLKDTAWNGSSGHPELTMKPYSEDGDPTTFTQAEANTIAEVWLRMAEDYAPFDIDVTTERPAAFGPQVGHVLFSPRLDSEGRAVYPSAVGGVAYVGVWGDSFFPYYQPALVFPEGVSGAKNLTEAGSHELGHNLGLSHDGTASLGYYGGHGTGNVSWGPIMGVGYYTNVTQWSKGEYAGANNQQDDVRIIADRLTYRKDDHGQTTDKATPLVVSSTGQVVSFTPAKDPFRIQGPRNKGIIHTRSDVDVFSVNVTAPGRLTLSATPSWRDGFVSGLQRSANLDLRLQVFRHDPAATSTRNFGTLVGSHSPRLDTNALVSVVVTPGRYNIVISGVSPGNILGTGYSDYGSLGQYFINGRVPVATARTVAAR